MHFTMVKKAVYVSFVCLLLTACSFCDDSYHAKGHVYQSSNFDVYELYVKTKSVTECLEKNDMCDIHVESLGYSPVYVQLSKVDVVDSLKGVLGNVQDLHKMGEGITHLDISTAYQAGFDFMIGSTVGFAGLLKRVS